MFSFEVNKTEILMKEKEQMTSGSVKVYTVVFDFSSDWDSFYKTVIFKAGSTIRNVYLGFTSSCTVPWEVLVMPNVKILIGVYGENNTGSVLPTVWTELGPVLLGVDAGDGVDPAPTPDSLQEAIAYKQDKLTGAQGQVVGFDEGGNAQSLTLVPKDSVKINQDGTNLTVGALVPGKNLLLNWDFRNPVNRTRFSASNSHGLTIDRWKLIYGLSDSVSLDERGLIISAQTANFAGFSQQCTDIDALRGKVVTMSLLCESGLYSATSIIPVSSDSLIDTPDIRESPVSLDIYSSQQDQAKNIFTFRIIVYKGNTEHLIAAKLELGDHQTLARQNADGEWEIIDPPDYDLQYALCSLYSPTTGEWVGSQHSNPNLLDNAYWANPDAIIDQRGGHIVGSGVTYYSDAGLTTVVGTTSAAMTAQRVNDTYGTVTISGTTYYVAAADVVRGYVSSYSIDRFIISLGGAVRLSSDGVIVSRKVLGSSYAVFYERVNASPLLGKTVTLSAIVNGELYTATGKVQDTIQPTSTKVIVGEKSNDIWVQIYFGVNGTLEPGVVNKSDADCTVKAVKLELGSRQTLAHQNADGEWEIIAPPPNKALELAKCQRYYYQSWTGGPITAKTKPAGRIIVPAINYAHLIPVRFPTTMRATPTISIFSLLGEENTVLNWSKDDTPVNDCYTTYYDNNGFMVGNARGFTAGDCYSFHYAASADL